MLNTVYRLVHPRTFEPVRVQSDTAGMVVVRPTHLSICNADMRYYLGARAAEVLAKKLPMALIHEGVGTVVRDASGSFTPGEQVVMLPNDPVEKDDFIAENYLRTSRFCGSGFDGFMQEYVMLPPVRAIALPPGANPQVAAFTELVSVAVHAVARFGGIAHDRRGSIGIWGDGNLGFIVALVLRMTHPSARIYIVGRTRSKLGSFTFADGTFVSNDLSEMPTLDHAFECAGGDGSASAIDQIIDCIKPEGTVSLLGVSENPPPVNTRMVLEKGLRLFGSSRSGRIDFEDTIALYKRRPEMLDYLSSLVGVVQPVRSIADMSAAFEADIRKPMGKTVMEWMI